MKQIQLWTGRVLRDYPELRNVANRNDLVETVWKDSGIKFSSESITRAARHLQNKLGLYPPKIDDTEQRAILEQSYREEYKNVKA